MGGYAWYEGGAGGGASAIDRDPNLPPVQREGAESAREAAVQQILEELVITDRAPQSPKAHASQFHRTLKRQIVFTVRKDTYGTTTCGRN